jgi:hypothetical protein
MFSEQRCILDITLKIYLVLMEGCLQQTAQIRLFAFCVYTFNLAEVLVFGGPYCCWLVALGMWRKTRLESVDRSSSYGANNSQDLEDLDAAYSLREQNITTKETMFPIFAFDWLFGLNATVFTRQSGRYPISNAANSIIFSIVIFRSFPIIRVSERLPNLEHAGNKTMKIKIICQKTC